MEEHAMHAEQIVVTKSAIEQLLERAAGTKDRPVVCVGTTALRTLESVYWLGRQLRHGNELLNVGQWEPYENAEDEMTVEESLYSVYDFLRKKKRNQLTAETSILIAPGYSFRLVDGLITNFHLPQSTLLLLIAAFIGDDWRKAYEYALQHDFRFLSYGDAGLLWKNG